MTTVVRLGGIAALTLFAGSAATQDLATELSAAQKLFDEKRYVESLERLEGAIQAVSAAIPLSVRAATLIEEASAYGSYVPRSSNVFAPDDKVKVYVEPVGYAHRRNGDTYEVELVGDFALKTATGQTLLAEKDFARFPLASRRPNREFYLSISYSYRNLKPGHYVIATTLRDLVGGKSASFEVPIRVESAPANEKPTDRAPN